MMGARTVGELDNDYRLIGEKAEFQLNKKDMYNYLGTLEDPVIFNKNLFWPEEISTFL